MIALGLAAGRRRLTFWGKLLQINWGLALVLTLVASIGFATLYSAGGGSFEPWSVRQMMRFGVGFVVMVALATVDIRIWFRWAYAIYAAAIALLVAVEVAGRIGMGAQRWLDLGVFQFQPTEMMRVALIMVLARYFHCVAPENVGRPHYLLWPAVLALAPAFLVFKQPDLGSAVLLLSTAGALFFLGGVRIWKFALLGGLAIAAVPVAWSFLRDYQKQRVWTFLDPESDPLGAGYHIIQSKIALGSGGIWGKGYLQGTQGHLQFLPEKQTDFIFTMLTEEWGIVGGLTLLALYTVILLYGLAIALRARSQFGRLLAAGVIVSFYVYAFINMSMVMGLLPVVGVPLPLVSYGGTSMMTLLASFGLLIGVYVHRDVQIARDGGVEE
ncbi:MAG TPA: rod shape-determining protein RodA [Alphaproteobacteria bacterium]|jgi:rod shape determining protein RodA|nr:rod shape-determining protein RodA [Alphaproteobacteria bacterium]